MRLESVDGNAHALAGFEVQLLTDRPRQSAAYTLDNLILNGQRILVETYELIHATG